MVRQRIRPSRLKVLCMLSCVYSASPQPALSRPSLRTAARTVLIAFWNLPDSEATINVTRDQFGMGEMQIWQNKKKVFSFSPNSHPQSVFELQDGNLATIWHHPDGLRHLYVFGMTDGKIVRLIDDTSRLDPEFVYQTGGHFNADVEKVKNVWQTKGGPFFTQKINLADTDWVLSKEKYLGMQSEILPTTVIFIRATI